MIDNNLYKYILETAVAMATTPIKLADPTPTHAELGFEEKLLGMMKESFEALNDGSLPDIFGTQAESSGGRPCGRMFANGEPIYRCNTCGLDDTCVMCAACFHSSHDDLPDHDVDMHISSGVGGCCDCGDPEAWKVPLQCKFHAQSLTNHATEEAPEFVKRAFRAICEFILDTWVCAPERNASLRSEPITAAQIEAFESQASISPTASRQTWQLCLWNDEEHSFRDVSDNVSRLLSCSNEAGLNVAREVDKVGRMHIARDDELDGLIAIYEELRLIGLTCTIRPVVEDAREDLSVRLVEFMRSVCSKHPLLFNSMCSVLLEKPLFERLQSASTRVADLNICKELASWDAAPRVAWLLVLDDRMPKSFRVAMREFVLSVLGYANMRPVILDCFTRCYKRFVLRSASDDIENQYSVLNLSVQLLTVPSLAVALFKARTLPYEILCMLDTILANATKDEDGAAALALAVDRLDLQSYSWSPNVEPLSDSAVEGTDAYWYGHSVFDLNYIMSAPSVKEALLQVELSDKGSGLFRGVFGVLARLQGIDCQMRRSDTHVLFESETWTHAFNLMLHIADFMETITSCFSGVEFSIQFARNLLQRQAQLTRYRQTLSQAGIAFKRRCVCDSAGGYMFEPVDSETDGLSFHHPLNWVFAQTIDAILCSDCEVDLVSVFGSLQSAEDREAVADIVDESVLTLLFCAEVKAQRWVRNGLHMREQVIYYRKLNLRQIGFENDLFLLQTFACVAPAAAVELLLTRFSLYKQNPVMLLEALSILGYIYSFRSRFEGRDKQWRLKQLVAHYLEERNQSFSQLELKCRPAKEEELNAVLCDIAELHFDSAAGGISSGGAGYYTLKPEAATPELLHPLNMALDRPWEVYMKHCGADFCFARSSATLSQLPGCGKGFFQIVSFALSEWLRALNGADAKRESASTGVEHPAMVSLWILRIVVAELGGAQTCELIGNFAPELFKTLVHIQTAAVRAPDLKDGSSKNIKLLLESIFSQTVQYFPDEDRQQLCSAASSANAVASDSAEANARKRKMLAKERQAKLLEQMAKQQQVFLSNASASARTENASGTEDSQSMCSADDHDDAADKDICIFCMDEFSALSDFESLDVGRVPVILGHASSSMFLMDAKFRMSSCGGSAALSDGFVARGEWVEDDAFSGMVLKSCGHKMHGNCYETFFTSAMERARSQAMFLRADMLKAEFACPLCKSICNFVVPVLPPSALFESGCAFETSPWEDLDFSACYVQPRLATDKPTFKRNVDVFFKLIAKYQTFKRLCAVNMQVPDLCTLSAPKPSLTAQHIANIVIDSVIYTVRSLQAQQSSLGPFFKVSEAHYTLLWQLMRISNQLLCLYGCSETGVVAIADFQQSEKAYNKRVGGFYDTDGDMDDRDSLKVNQMAEMVFPKTENNDDVVSIDDTQNSGRFELYIRHTILPVLSSTGAINCSSAPEKVLAFVRATTRKFFFVNCYTVLMALCLIDKDRFYGHLVNERVCGAIAPEEGDAIFASFLKTWHHKFEITDADKAKQIAVSLFLQYIYALLQTYQMLLCVACPDDRFLATASIAELIELFELPSFSQVFSLLSGVQHEARSSAYIKDLLRVGEPPAACSLPRIEPYSLIALPHELNDFLEKGLTTPCVECGTIPSEPAVCMQCGKLVCAKGMCCADVEELGECNIHSMKCTCSYGMFFLVKKARIVLLYDGSGCSIQTPYRDCHGEGSYHVAHHKPMFLVESKYKELNKLYITQSIPNEVYQHAESDYLINYWLSY